MPLRWSGCAIVAALVAACGGSSGPAIPTYTISYVLTGDPLLQCDSVKYENVQGQIVLVAAPSLPWHASFAAQSGHYISATAWVRATNGGQEGKLKMSWTIPGVSTASDSSFGTSSAPGYFSLSVTRRQL